MNKFYDTVRPEVRQMWAENGCARDANRQSFRQADRAELKQAIRRIKKMMMLQRDKGGSAAFDEDAVFDKLYTMMTGAN